jgi:hypothetical protein
MDTAVAPTRDYHSVKVVLWATYVILRTKRLNLSYIDKA